MSQTSAKTANYIVAGLAVLGIVFCWVQHFQAKQTLRNPLIPQSISELYFKPALLFTVLYSVIAIIQLLSARYKKGQTVAAVLGCVLLVAARICYPYAVSWFMP
ncbi:hypothetical protein ACLI09_08130 [Flavobacterium sp. RHBU_24]|uniref:hypothetical protein n=1 Tax=Flavobacterium sp. RHBU_24 TaxID=3391185 RepID=UPI003984D1C3